MSGSDAATAFAHADIAISAGGQTMLELLYLGVPTVVVITSPDQESQVQDALSQKAIAGALKIDNPSLLDDLAKALQGLYSWDTRNALSATASSYIDDRGAERIFNTIEKSLHEKV
jgi:spore coat polysaccharide biosynthesis predicted glycosyltransferase SpsG